LAVCLRVLHTYILLCILNLQVEFRIKYFITIKKEFIVLFANLHSDTQI